MRRTRLNKSDEEELTRLARAGNATQRPGLDPQARKQAAAVYNERALEWLGEEEHRPAEAWVWVPPNRERLALVIIARSRASAARIFFTISKRRGDRPRSDAAGTGRHCGRARMRAIKKYAPRVYLPAIA